MKSNDENLSSISPIPAIGHSSDLQTFDASLEEPQASPSPIEHVKFAMDDQIDANDIDEPEATEYFHHEDMEYQSQHFGKQRNTSPFQNKRQTGKKNISNIIVGCDNKIEFDQIEDKGLSVIKINRPIGVHASRVHEHLNDNDSVYSRDSEHTHTAEGFFDLKFYSHPLW